MERATKWRKIGYHVIPLWERRVYVLGGGRRGAALRKHDSQISASKGFLSS